MVGRTPYIAMHASLYIHLNSCIHGGGASIVVAPTWPAPCANHPRRVVYKCDGADSKRFQVGLSEAEKAELDGMSLQALLAAMKRAAVQAKQGQQASKESQFCGVRKGCGKNQRWRAVYRPRLPNGSRQHQSSWHDSEELAATAYDRMVLKVQGRCAVVPSDAAQYKTTLNG